MRTTVSRVMLPAVVVMAVTAGCSSDSGGAEEDLGKPAGEVCGAFAKDPQPSAALKAIGGERFRDDLSDPDEVLQTLRQVAEIEQSAKMGKPRMQGKDFCWLFPAKGGDDAIRIQFRESLGVPGRDARLAGKVTYFSTGERASSSDGLTSVFFKCRMKPPAHEITLQAWFEGPDVPKAPRQKFRSLQVTVVNAAARKVAADLACQNDTKLVTGVPALSP
ncbi:hypothetical protein [Streptomyces sp. NPDC006368]|uniref:hypothetical protein n=1 Tax=Streptomyces sp. NPDC006368 TaxID=3156760 RepID=UPI0033AA4890